MTPYHEAFACHQPTLREKQALRNVLFCKIIVSHKWGGLKIMLWNISGWEGGGVLSYKRLLGMCRWMGSHFHDWSDYNGVAFSIELLEWGRKFSDFWGK